jgi:6-bladed beta-propeller
MKKYLFLSILSFVTILSCSKKEEDSSLFKINVQQSLPTKEKFVDLMQISGFSSLKVTGDCNIRTINNVIFKGDNIVVLDNDTDFKNIWLFNQNGDYLQKIGKQGDEDGAYDYLSGIAWYKDNLICVDAAKNSFFEYDLKGIVHQKIPNGLYGDDVETDEQGNIFAYNECGASEFSGLNYLIVFDKDGNIINKMMPYPKEKDDLSFGYTGTLCKSDNKIWFTPPFSSTIYQVDSKNCIPKYQFDFGEQNIPSNLLEQKINSSDIRDYGFLTEYFAKVGTSLLIETQVKSMIRHGLYNELNQNFYDLNSMERDCLSKLILRGTVINKNNEEFALILRANQVKKLIEQNLVDFDALDTQFAGLGQTFKSMAGNETPVLIYFKPK